MAVSIKVRLDAIQLDSSVQSRAVTSPDIVDEYALAMGEGVQFPPVSLLRLTDSGICIAVDGFHRVLAARKCGFVDIDATIVDGDRHDAVLAAAGANGSHGLQRTNADKRRAISMLLGDPKWQARTDTWIAEAVRVDQTTVSRCRKELNGDNRQNLIRETASGGKVNVEGRGRKKKDADPQPMGEPVNDVVAEPKAETEGRFVEIQPVRPAKPEPPAPKGFTNLTTAILELPIDQLETLHTIIGNLLRSKRTG